MMEFNVFAVVSCTNFFGLTSPFSVNDDCYANNDIFIPCMKN